MASRPTILEARGVSFAYDRNLVVREVDLSLPAGRGVALAGPNGSGKTTLLKLFAGDNGPLAGEVILDERAIHEVGVRERARRIAVVPQHIDPHLAFPVRSIVSMGRTPHGGLLGWLSLADRRAIERALRATDTEELAGRRFDELSGGEQQRVMLALALAQEADFLLLDEPTIHLDLQHQHELLELLGRLRQDRGLGVLAVMHDLNLAALYFDELAILQGGSLVADGEPAEVLTWDKLGDVFRAPLTTVSHPQEAVPQVLLNPGGSSR
jgi:ABC-type cobalamin/Fe3+-siderophores transport system ATPase subunit